MSAITEGLVLSPAELMAIMYLGQKKSFFGFATEENGPTEEEVLQAICTLSGEGLISLQEDGVEIRQDLYRLILPIMEAGKVMVLFNAVGIPETMYYLGAGITAVDNTITGAYALEYVDQAELAEHLCGHSCVRCYDESYPVRGTDDFSELELDAPRQRLLSQADFLVTLVDAESQAVTGWMRGRRQGAEPWLEILDQNGPRMAVLKMKNLERELELFLKGVWT